MTKMKTETMTNMSNRKYSLFQVVLAVAALVMGGVTASAQRTVSGQSSLAVSAHYGGTSVGAEAFYQQYTPGGFWEAGATGTPHRTPLPSTASAGSAELVLEYAHVAAAGGYFWRLAATRDRALDWYAGAGAFMGVEWMDPFGRLPAQVVLGAEEIRFLYGVYAATMLEVFLGRKFALLVRGGAPVNFSARTGYVHWQAGLGFKVLFN